MVYLYSESPPPLLLLESDARLLSLLSLLSLLLLVSLLSQLSLTLLLRSADSTFSRILAAFRVRLHLFQWGINCVDAIIGFGVVVVSIHETWLGTEASG